MLLGKLVHCDKKLKRLSRRSSLGPCLSRALILYNLESPRHPVVRGRRL